MRVCLIFFHFVLRVFAVTLSNFSNTQIQQYEENYNQIRYCLFFGTKKKLKFPTDAVHHYEDLQSVTAKFRGLPPHIGSGLYNGTWIENEFISYFINQPLAYFGGMFPLFVQWSDYELSSRIDSTGKTVTTEEIFRVVTRHLRSDVIYITVSQANNGLLFLIQKYPNVIILSAGGVGHIAIPLIKGNIEFSPVTEEFPQFDLTFLGSIDHGPRSILIDAIKSEMKKSKEFSDLKTKFGLSHIWKREMSLTKFNLAPIGFGRGTFRFSEIVQMGRIPVYAYADYPWLPYEGTKYSPNHIGLIINLKKPSEISGFLKQVKTMSNDTINMYLDRVQEASNYYRMEGVLQQIELFFNSPLRNGYLKCNKEWIKRTEIFSANLLR